jgi:hypothetical protein
LHVRGDPGRRLADVRRDGRVRNGNAPHPSNDGARRPRRPRRGDFLRGARQRGDSRRHHP